MTCAATHDINTSKITVEVIRMRENRELILRAEIKDLKARCRELSHENLFLKSEIADMRMTNVLLGGAL